MRFIEYTKYFPDLIILGVYYKNELIGFTMNEISWDGYAVLHYEKADSNYIGIFEYLMQQTAIYLN